MKNHLASATTLCLLLTCLFAHHSALAQHFNDNEVFSGILFFDSEAAPLVSTEATINVAGMLTRTRLTQTFENNTTQWQEAIYAFPLPDDASVDLLEMKIGDRTINGTIKPKKQAAQEYETAKRQGKRASLIKQQRKNLFTTNISNIAPGESIVITIGFQSSVHYDEGVFSLNFPLTITPRYLPGQRLHSNAPTEETLTTNATGWAGMQAISPPMTTAVNAAQTRIAVVINAGIPLQTIDSDTHSIITTQDNNVWRIELADTTVPMDRDFTLTWTPPLGQSPHAAVFSETRTALPAALHNRSPDQSGTESFASIMLLPPQDLFKASRLPREVIFVIDTSGSMQGNSIRQARKALSFGIKRLSPEDTFNVIEFDNTANALFAIARQATALNKSTAFDWVDGLYADGGTEIAEAMKLALKHDNQFNTRRIRQIVFVTDGSVGNEDEIFRYINQHLGHSRLFTVGIGSAPNIWFMRKAAETGRGSYTLISHLHDVQDKMLQLFCKLERPVLTDIKISFNGVAEPERYPATIPDLYAGEPVLADARWQGAIGKGEITISGTHAGQAWSRQLQLLPRKTDQTTTGQQLAKRFAYRKIESLEDSLLFDNQPDKIEQQITDIALTYGIVSNYTSLIAIEDKISRDPSLHGLNAAEIPSAMPAGNTMAFPKGSLGIAWRWMLALLFSVLAVLFGLATLYQVRSHGHSPDQFNNQVYT